MMKTQLTHHANPIGFWAYVTGSVLLLALGWVSIGLLIDPPLLKVMAVGLLLFLGGFLLAPSTLDLTGWTITVMMMQPIGLILMIGSPLVYALYVTFLGEHITIH